MARPFKAFFFFPFLTLTLAACGSGSEQSKEETQEAPRKELSTQEEDSLFIALSSYLIPNPKNQAEEENNTLANYAMDQLLAVHQTPSGLFYAIQRPGQGDSLRWGDRIEAHYRGTFLDGKAFDDSYARGEPLSFYIGNMIDGWNEGMQLVRPGGKIILLIPSKLGYGPEGLMNSRLEYLVPPNQPLIFEVEVLRLVKKAE